VIEYKKYIRREYIRQNRHKTFLFGDNLEHLGYGGQAKEMRGEPNAIGTSNRSKTINFT